MAQGDQACEIVRQQLATDIESSDCGVKGLASEQGGDRCVGVACVDDEESFGGGVCYACDVLGCSEYALDIVVGVKG